MKLKAKGSNAYREPFFKALLEENVREKHCYAVLQDAWSLWEKS